VQKFTTMLSVDGVDFYKVDSSFGWFLPQVFEKQTGLDNGKYLDCWHVANSHGLAEFALPADEPRLFAAAGLGAHALGRRLGQAKYLDRVGFSPEGGKYGKGYGHGFKQVDKRDWFFSCHFWCDSVMPGSLGVEAMHQTLELWCVQNGVAAGIANPQFAHDLGKTMWKYRGQLTPKNGRCDVEVHIKSVEKDGSRATVVADGFLYVDGLRVYEVKFLRIQVRAS
jgi:3-hydroxymyristoyl/3-hydroxydecanoyl-(acyl carrier protein) dehydratase